MSFLERVNPQTDILEAVEHLISAKRSENTQRAYRYDWGLWREFCVARAVDLKIPTLPTTIAFRDELKISLSSKTVDRVLTTLSWIYKSFQAMRIVPINPFDAAWLARPAVVANPTVAIPQENAESILGMLATDTSPIGRRDYAVLRLLYDTGLRRSSVCSCQRQGFVRVGNKYFLTVMVKGGTRQEVGMLEETGLALAAWIKVAPPSAWMFPGRNREKPMQVAMVNKIVTSCAWRAGIPHVKPHSFRASYITTGYDAKIYEHDLQASVHHASADMTRHYDRGARGFDVPIQIGEFRKGKK